MISNKTLGKKPFETLTRVSRYYIDKKYDKKTVRDMLDSFLIQCDPCVSLSKWSETLDNAVAQSLKRDAILLDGIPVTDSEMKVINSIESKQLKRLAFTLLVLSKYWNVVNKRSDGWVNNKDNEIMSMANINTSIKRQSLMFWQLKDLGLIQFSKKIDNTNVRVLFAEDGENVFLVKNLKNIGYQLLMFMGEPYFECENCGVTVKIDEPNKGRRQKYCKECAAEIKTKQMVNSVMRFRERKKTENC